MIRALIVDDVRLARERLRRCLAGETGVEVVGECEDGAGVVAAVRTLAPDLIFLDVQMPELDGFGVLDALGEGRRPAVVFVTAYNEYAVRAFEVNALDYLLKPVDCERLVKAVGRVREQLARPPEGGDIDRRLRSALSEVWGGPKYLKRLTVRLTGRTLLLPVDEIDWVETYGNYLRIHAGREAHLIRATLQSLEGRLDPEKFVRVHRSTLVNVEKIKEIYPRSNGDQDLILRDGRRLLLSRNYRDRFLDALGEV